VLLALAIVGLFVLPAPWGVIAVFSAAVIEVGEVVFWIRFLRRYPVTTGAEGLVGERGQVIVRCAPLGRVRLRGEIWNARSEEPLELGEGVRVEAVDGLTLAVARAGNATRKTALGATPSSAPHAAGSGIGAGGPLGLELRVNTATPAVRSRSISPHSVDVHGDGERPPPRPPATVSSVDQARPRAAEPRGACQVE
jgi:membrane protein implicated in regulation of membrane protease activity